MPRVTEARIDKTKKLMSASKIFLSIFAAIALFLYGWRHSAKKFSA